MRAQRSPQEKKRLSLAKDHPLSAKYPHGFRRSWPKKKRMAQQAFRREVKQELARGKGSHDPVAVEWVDPGGVRRQLVRKWSAAPLGEVIKNKQRRRILTYRRKKNARL